VQRPCLGVFNRVLPTTYSNLNLKTPSVGILRYQLCESLKLRVLNVPAPPGLNQEHNVCVAILFSGGLDCTVLARMVHDILPPEQHIDLINVAFENPRVVQAADNAVKSRKPQSADVNVQVNINQQDIKSNKGTSTSQSPFESCPDRETGRKALQELRTVCPDRLWRFVAVSISEKTIKSICIDGK
jgi:asparagine synthetase B (glutamine-hydrolysing)